MRHRPLSGTIRPAVRAAVGAGLAAALAVALPVPGTAAGAPPPVDTTAPEVREIRFSRPSVTVSGLSVARVTLSVRLSDPSGVHEGAGRPWITLTPVPGPSARTELALHRTAGSAEDGVWSAQLNVPSTWHGLVRVASLYTVDGLGNERPAGRDGLPATTLRVRGTNRPVLTMAYTRLRTGGFQLQGRAYLAGTGKPIARRGLTAERGGECTALGVTRVGIRTDARGRYLKRFPPGAAATGCVMLVGPAAPRQLAPIVSYRVASGPGNGGQSIPDSALLQSSDLNGATPTAVTDNLWARVRPPRPCGAGNPDGRFRLARRTVSAMIGVGERPTVVMEHVTTYRADGAQRYLRELRRALTRCTGANRTAWTVLSTGTVGDDSVLLRLREFVDYGGGTPQRKDTFLAVARTGRAVVVVADHGWEVGNGRRWLVEELIGTAVHRADRLNN